MSNQGNVSVIPKFKGKVLGGNLILPALYTGKIRIERNVKHKETSPDYILQRPNVDEHTGEVIWASCGAAWDKEKGELKFISVSMDLYDKNKRIGFALFPSDDQPKNWKEGDDTINFNVSYNPFGKSKPKAGNASLDDAIDF